MLELVRSTNTYFTLALPEAQQRGLVVGIAQTPDELEQIQRLRHDVFSEEFGVTFSGAASGLDTDQFDRWCEHLMVQDLGTGQVVGTYRVLTPLQAKRAGGYYSESEFDLSGLHQVKSSLVEFGRACIHPDYRQGSALMMLWTGLAKILKQGRYEHVFGCASVSLRDDGHTASCVWRSVKDTIGADGRPVVRPLHHYPVDQVDSDLPAKVPALLNGYLKLGARICGEPAWDPDFNSADFPMLLSVSDMGMRYRKHFGLD